jgi:hypothetical protein
MLKISPEKIAIPLQIIFNKSLRQCKYPSSWKNAHVTAIFTLSKAFEKSQKTKQHSSFFSREFKIVLYSSINWWTGECLGKKPEKLFIL